MNDIRVIVPVHDGRRTIAGVVEKLRRHAVAVLVVNDGSSDQTASLAESAGAEVLNLPSQMGKGRALRAGMAWALSSEPQPSWLVFCDGDGQHLPEELPRFIERMKGDIQLLLGSRMAGACDIPPARLATNRAGSRVLHFMTGEAVPDTQCGYRAIRADLAERLDLESEGFEIETEMLLKALKLGAKWEAVPVSAVYEGESSHYRPVADTFRICMAALRYVR